MSMNTAKLYIGTSGWCYDSWAGNFYPGDLNKNKWLKYYYQYFNTDMFGYAIENAKMLIKLCDT